jgi:hypothetical protein
MSKSKERREGERSARDYKKMLERLDEINSELRISNLLTVRGSPGDEREGGQLGSSSRTRRVFEKPSE